MGLLPQTTFRLSGLKNQRPKLAFQLEYLPRTKNEISDNNYINSVYGINKLMFKELEIQFCGIIEKKSKFEINQKHLVDMHLLNLFHHFQSGKITGRLNVVDYANLRHRILNLRDIEYFNEFARSIIRNTKLKLKYPIAIVHTLDFHRNSALNLFWKNEFLNINEIDQFAKKFISNNLFRFPELKNISQTESILMICPHIDDNLGKLKNNINKKIGTNEAFREIFYGSNHIIIKQHRAANFNYPDSFYINDKKVITLNSFYTRVLPVEMIIRNYKNLNLLTNVSSAMFSAGIGKVWSFGDISKNDSKDYGLLLKSNAKIFPKEYVYYDIKKN